MNRNSVMRSAASTLETLQKGARAGGKEVFDFTYYDTCSYADGNEIRLFTASVGQNGKTKAETNMKTPGAIPQGQRLTVAKIKAFLFNSAPQNESNMAEIYNMIFRTTVDIVLPGKMELGSFPLSEIMGISSLLMIKPEGTGGANIPIIQPRFHGILPLNSPLILPALQPFEIVVRPNGSSSEYTRDTQLRIGLNGILESAY